MNDLLHEEFQYLNLLKKILKEGEERSDRTGVGTLSIFSERLVFSLKNTFPLITTKKLHTKSIIHELLWFLKGDTNIKYLKENGVSIWNEWADENGNLGPVYGAQWRNWKNTEGKRIDQVSNLIKSIRENPFSRRHILSSWNVGELSKMALPPCHILAQFYVNKDKELSCQLYQRSVDIFLGLPFNIASYALLTCILAKITETRAKNFYFIGGDLHLYSNHIRQAKMQCEREPYPLSKLKLSDKILDIDKLQYEDIKILDYKSHPKILAPIAV